VDRCANFTETNGAYWLAQEAEGADALLISCRLRYIISAMNIPKQQEQSIEERIGSMIGKIMVLALIAFFLGLWIYVGCKVGAILTRHRVKPPIPEESTVCGYQVRPMDS
jgi:hypothetical protein